MFITNGQHGHPYIRPVKMLRVGGVDLTRALHTSHSSRCHHHLCHPYLQWNPEWRQIVISLPWLSRKMSVTRGCRRQVV